VAREGRLVGHTLRDCQLQRDERAVGEDAITSRLICRALPVADLDLDRDDLGQQITTAGGQGERLV
jgi:hypothetical protein